VPCYEDVRHAGALHTPGQVRKGLEAELDKYTVWPDAEGGEARARPA
jgi:2-oxoglutarate ferredoxin oxidoreductase subunit beta